MIKRIILKIVNNLPTTDIEKFLPTNTTSELVQLNPRNIYLDVKGTESNVSEITSFKAMYISAITSMVDNNTDILLSKGFVWENVNFPMDIEHFNDYRDTVTYLKSGILIYPYTIMGANKQSVILTADNVDSFFSTGLSFKESTLQSGWNLCNTLKTLSEIELINFKDTRVE